MYVLAGYGDWLFFFKEKTVYEVRIREWGSGVGPSGLDKGERQWHRHGGDEGDPRQRTGDDADQQADDDGQEGAEGNGILKAHAEKFKAAHGTPSAVTAVDAAHTQYRDADLDAHHLDAVERHQCKPTTKTEEHGSAQKQTRRAGGED